jgi:hypothetical protein
LELGSWLDLDPITNLDSCGARIGRFDMTEPCIFILNNPATRLKAYDCPFNAILSDGRKMYLCAVHSPTPPLAQA